MSGGYNQVFICPECQTENRPTAKFCRKCGQERPAGVVAEESVDSEIHETAEEKTVPESGNEYVQMAEEPDLGQMPQAARAEAQAQESNVVSFPGGESVMPDEPQPREQRRGGPTCPACASNVRLSDKFCIWCGERQPQRARPKMKRCSECRTLLVLSANFCYVCGNDVGLHQRRKVRVPSELFKEDDPDLFPKFEA